MSEKIRRIFEDSMELALREEKLRADKLKTKTQNIPLAHMLCRCGEPLRDKLVKNLITASSLTFEKFMTCCLKEYFLIESHEIISILRKNAELEKRHLEVMFLEHLAKMSPTITLQHLISSLKEAQLYRAIAGIDIKSIQALSNHTSSHNGLGCCMMAVETRGLTVPSSSGIVGGPRLYDKKSPLPHPGLILGANISSVPSKVCRGIVLITFLEDGKNHAKRVQEVLEEPTGKSGRSYKVYTLSDFTQLIMEDFVQNILWIISQVNFVVPILSENYICMLDDESVVNSSIIDEKFAPYVARLLLADWASNFKNKRLRCFKPKNVLWPPHKLIYPPFLTAVNEPSALPSILKTSKY